MILPFDPIERSKEMEKIVMRGNERAYYRFRHADFYGPGGIVTADAVGCNLLCAPCWNYARNEAPENVGTFCQPSEVAQKLRVISEKKRCKQFRISGSEPFLGVASAKHIAEVIRATKGNFVIESNGLMLGYMPELIDLFDGLNTYWRICIKGHDEETFQRVTGARGEYFKYAPIAIQELRNAGASLEVAYMAAFVPIGKAATLTHTLRPKLEPESLRYYAGVKGRIEARGLRPKA